jgi:chemotaxis protein methyltransferase CheR
MLRGGGAELDRNTDLGRLVLKPGEFRAIVERVGAITGMNLQEGKEDLVKARLLKRLRLLGLDSFGAYLSVLERDQSGAELSNLVDVLTTNQTSFFREREHFDFLKKHFLPVFGGRSIRVWSSACSSGEEPYSIGMLLREEVPDLARWDAKILATDISTKVLAKAAEGFYPMDALNGISPSQLQAHFTGAEVQGRQGYRVKPELAALVKLARLNLMEDWPMQGPFDVIFCRNVMIYFNKETQERLVNRFWRLIRPGGYLLVGHSESLSGLKHPYRYVQPAVYEKPSGGAP